jgi:hypothetical protein
MSMKNSSDTIGNKSSDLPVCSAVPQPLRHRVPHSSTTPCTKFGHGKRMLNKIQLTMKTFSYKENKMNLYMKSNFSPGVWVVII